MKYILLILTSVALIGSASAVSATDCCNGCLCCLVQAGCCTK